MYTEYPKPPMRQDLLNSSYANIVFGVVAVSLLIVILVFAVSIKSTIDAVKKEVHKIESEPHVNLSVLPQNQPNYDSQAWGNTTCDDANSCTTDLLVTVEGNTTCAHYHVPNNVSCSDVCTVPQTGTCLGGECNGLCKGFCPSPIDFSEEICPNIVYKPSVIDANLNGSLSGKLCFYSQCLYVVEWPYISDWTCPPNVNMLFYDDDQNCMDLLDDSFEEKKCFTAQSLCLDTYWYGVKKVCLYHYACSSMNVESLPPAPEPTPTPTPTPTEPLAVLPPNTELLHVDEKINNDNKDHNTKDYSTQEHKATGTKKHNRRKTPKSQEHVKEQSKPAQKHEDNKHENNKDQKNTREEYIKHLKKIGHGRHGMSPKRGAEQQVGSANDALTVNQFVITALGGDSLYEFIRINLMISISQRLESMQPPIVKK